MKLNTLVMLALLSCTAACGQQSSTPADEQDFPVQKTEEEWKEELNPQQFHILRQKGTERAFTGQYYKHKAEGTYHCAGCKAELFSSDTKYESGCGWPSFYDVIDGQRIKEVDDRSHGMRRTEVVCGNCGGHLGHVFNDGPKPTGLRYCINSASLEFRE